jgi:ATP adenylyltransferase
MSTRIPVPIAGRQAWHRSRPDPTAENSPPVGSCSVANFRIWAPWRLEYVKDASKDSEEECIFCAKPAQDDDEGNLIVYRGESCFVLLNLFPYTNGHLMIAPYDHLARLQDLGQDTVAEMMALARRAMDRLEEVYDPHGYNVGFNQGRVAGAGFEHHIHMHVVPRWGGDTNFMPVIADTRVMPQSLEDSYEALRGGFG